MKQIPARKGRTNRNRSRKRKQMKFPTPSDSVSTETQTETQTESEPETEEETVYEALNDEMKEKLQYYWGVVDTYRGIGKMARSYLFDSPEGVTNSDIAALQDRSPIAAHFVQYKDYKDAEKKEFQQLREDDEIPNEVGLRGFKEEFDPTWEYDILNLETAEDWGVDPDSFFDDEDDILVPEQYESPTDEDGGLKIWHDEAGDEVSDDEVIATIKDTSGVDSKAPDILETLKEAGYKVVHN